VLLSSLVIAALVQDAPQRSPGEAVVFELKAILPAETGRRLPWSPKGRPIELLADPPEDWRTRLGASAETLLIDPLFAALEIGPAAGPPVLLAWCRGERGRPHRDRLLIDADRDGRLDPERERLEARAAARRDRVWIEFPSVIITMPWEDDPATRHEFTLWSMSPVEAPDAAPPRLFITARSWMEGEITIDGTPYRIALLEFDNDGRFTRLDRWLIVPDGPQAEERLGKIEPLASPVRPCFIGEQAYRLSDVSSSAARAAVRRSDDLLSLPPAPDESRPLAERDAAWLNDLGAALQQAAREHRPVLVAWTAMWSGPCRVLERTTLRDAAIVSLLEERYIGVRMDRDDRIDLAARQGVREVPALIIFDSNGRELARRTGAATAAELEAWLREHRAGSARESNPP
jgi:hypothetical protein